jgi:predicted permease
LYPKEVSHKQSKLIHPGLTAFGGPARAFLAGLMMLALLILLAACANLGSLFAARASDRGREIALRLALGSNRRRILRQLLTEAMLLSFVGGAAGLAGSIALLRKLSTWAPFPGAPIHLPVNPDAKIYGVALILAVVCSLLFGVVPTRQVLRTDPYSVLKAGGTGAAMRRRVTLRDVLLVLQIAICAVLVTSSLVAVRGLVRSLTGDFGFKVQDAMTVNINLASAGYSGDRVPTMQKRMIEAMQTIPGVEHAGMVNGYPPLVYGAGDTENVFRNETTDLKQANAAASPYRYAISPGYLDAAGTRLLAGRDLSWHDDKSAPQVAVVNREFAEKLFGSVSGAIGRYFKLHAGVHVQVVGVVENGKYVSLTEDQQTAIFLPSLQAPASSSYLIIRSRRESLPLIADIKSSLKGLDAGLPADVESWRSLMDVVFFPARVATAALGVMGAMGALLAIIGVFGLAAYSVSKRLRELGIRVALGAQRREILATALGRALGLLASGSAAGLVLGLLATRVLASIVYQATPRDPVVLTGAVVVMMLLGLVATWIPARRALSVNPLVLLREE